MWQHVDCCRNPRSLPAKHSSKNFLHSIQSKKWHHSSRRYRISTKFKGHASQQTRRWTHAIAEPDSNKESKHADRIDERKKHDGPGAAGMQLASESRRMALISTFGHVGATLLPGRQAAAFPSPSLEALQESVASSSRYGGDTGISALRNPAIYR